MKNLPYIVILVLIGIILYLRMCSGTGNPVVVTRIDTQWLAAGADTAYIPVTTAIRLPGHETIREVPVPVYIEPDPLRVDTAAIIRNYFPVQQDYFSTRYYADSFDVQYGKAYRYDTVSRNRIIGTGMSLRQHIPVVTKTVYKSRTQLYIGGSLLGDMPVLNTHGQLVTGSELSLMLKTKTDLCVEAAFQKPWNDLPAYRIGVKVPLRFKRN